MSCDAFHLGETAEMPVDQLTEALAKNCSHFEFETAFVSFVGLSQIAPPRFLRQVVGESRVFTVRDDEVVEGDG